MKSHIIGFLLVTLAQIPMPIKIGTTFENKLRPTVDTALLLVWGNSLLTPGFTPITTENREYSPLMGCYRDLGPDRFRYTSIKLWSRTWFLNNPTIGAFWWLFTVCLWLLTVHGSQPACWRHCHCRRVAVSPSVSVTGPALVLDMTECSDFWP